MLMLTSDEICKSVLILRLLNNFTAYFITAEPLKQFWCLVSKHLFQSHKLVYVTVTGEDMAHSPVL